MSKNLINCDLGECLIPNHDINIMPLIDMANIACGGHAGNNSSMTKAIKLAKHNQVKIGAHPSYANIHNFGRISYKLSDKALYDLLYQQILNFKKLCNNNAVVLKYIKPHGALYHDMMQNIVVFNTICEVIRAIDTHLSLVVQAGFKKNTNISLLYEVFADRAYDGIKLIPRSEKNAVLDDTDAIIEQYKRFLTKDTFQIDTICFHSDNQASIKALKQLKNA